MKRVLVDVYGKPFRFKPGHIMCIQLAKRKRWGQVKIQRSSGHTCARWNSGELDEQPHMFLRTIDEAQDFIRIICQVIGMDDEGLYTEDGWLKWKLVKAKRIPRGL